MKCIVCKRTTIENSEYCIYHNKARWHLEENYKKWNDAYSTTFTWNQYLVQLSKLKNIGVWIKEVIDLEIKKS